MRDIRIERARHDCVHEATGEAVDDAEIESAVRRWAYAFGITGYKIRLNVFANPADEDAAYVMCQPEYMTADISLNLAKIEDLDSTIKHEIAHIVVWPLFHIARTLADTDAELEWIRYTNELVAETLERAPGLTAYEDDNDDFDFEPE